MLAECFELFGGVPKVVLADRMGCLKGGVVANMVVRPRPMSASPLTTGSDPISATGPTPESKGIVENLVGYAKADLMVPADIDVERLDEANTAAKAWCAEVNSVLHSEICARPVERLGVEAELLAPLPSLRPRIGRVTVRKVDRLSCGSAQPATRSRSS